MDDRLERMETVAQAVLDLSESSLYVFRQQQGYHPTIGEGSLQADILFIGEAPGAQEAKTGRPFVGPSGRVLDEMLASIGLSREDVYITNVVKDRPPENRDPTPDEIRLYAPFLWQQIEIIRPKVIATLGRFAMDFVLAQLEMPEAGQKISVLHGKALHGRAPYGEVTLVPLFHPAVALYNVNQRKTLEADFHTLKQYL